MQKKFEDIIAELNNDWVTVEEIHDDNGYKHKTTKVIPLENAIKIVNRIAEKYKQEVCEWIPNFERKIFTGHYYSDHDDGMMFTKVEVESFNVCPYCGKKIKLKGE